jgi:hypothetical protein
MHEIAIHHNHDIIEDFKPVYNLVPDQLSEPDFVTPAHIDSLSVSIDSIHKAFDVFLSLGVESVRSLPTLFTARTAYAAVALMKIYNTLSAKKSKFGSVFSPEDLKVDHYLNALIAFLREVGEGSKCRNAHKFVSIFTVLERWHSKDSNGIRKEKDMEEALAVVETQTTRQALPKVIQDATSTAWDTAGPSSQGQGMSNRNPFAGNGMMTVSGVGPNIDTFGFAPDELDVLGRLMEQDLSWLNFSAE